MLIASPRHAARDLESWKIAEMMDAVHCRLRVFRSRIQRAHRDILSFTGAGRCYAGVSWGKDSMVLADMIATICPRIPLVWVRVEPIANPDCVLVRDAFLATHRDVRYEEILVTCPPREREHGGWAIWDARGTLEAGFAQAVERFGERYLSGIRGDESGQRKRRMDHFGVSSKNTCAPLGYWSGNDVFAYLHERRLPVHPAYACTMGGSLDRSHLRVAALGGGRGTGMGRRQWEATYYPEEIKRLFDGRPAEGVA